MYQGPGSQPSFPKRRERRATQERQPKSVGKGKKREEREKNREGTRAWVQSSFDQERGRGEKEDPREERKKREKRRKEKRKRLKEKGKRKRRYLTREKEGPQR